MALIDCNIIYYLSAITQFLKKELILIIQKRAAV